MPVTPQRNATFPDLSSSLQSSFLGSVESSKGPGGPSLARKRPSSIAGTKSSPHLHHHPNGWQVYGINQVWEVAPKSAPNHLFLENRQTKSHQNAECTNAQKHVRSNTVFVNRAHEIIFQSYEMSSKPVASLCKYQAISMKISKCGVLGSPSSKGERVNSI